MKILGEGEGWKRWEDDDGMAGGAVWPTRQKPLEEMSQEEIDQEWQKSVEAVLNAFSGAWEKLAEL